MGIEARDMLEKISQIRLLVTKPSMKQPEQAREAILNYIREKHGVADPQDEAGRALLSQYRKWPAMAAILDYARL